MKLTLANLSESVRQELGRDPGRSTMEALVNEAGEAWVNLHRWFYLQERTGEVTLVSGTEEYALAPGIRSLHHELYRPDSPYANIPILDAETFYRERERYLSGSFRSFNPLALVWWDTKEGDTRPTLYLRVYPADRGERVTYRYIGGWLPLDEQDDVADVPPPLGQPFVEWVRRYAIARESDDVSVDQMTASFLAGPTGVLAKRVDAGHRGRIQPGLGAAERRYRITAAMRQTGAVTGLGPFSKLEYLEGYI